MDHEIPVQGAAWDIAERARDLIRRICQAREVSIIRGAVSLDHIHVLVAAPPQLAPAKLVQYIRGAHRGCCRKNFRNCDEQAFKITARTESQAGLSREIFGRLQPRVDFQLQNNLPASAGSQSL